MANLSFNKEDILPVDKQKVSQVLLLFFFFHQIVLIFLKIFLFKTSRFKITTKLLVIAKYPILHIAGILQYIKYTVVGPANAE